MEKHFEEKTNELQKMLKKCKEGSKEEEKIEFALEHLYDLWSKILIEKINR